MLPPPSLPSCCCHCWFLGHGGGGSTRDILAALCWGWAHMGIGTTAIVGEDSSSPLLPHPPGAGMGKGDSPCYSHCCLTHPQLAQPTCSLAGVDWNGSSGLERHVPPGPLLRCAQRWEPRCTPGQVAQVPSIPGAHSPQLLPHSLNLPPTPLP